MRVTAEMNKWLKRCLRASRRHFRVWDRDKYVSHEYLPSTRLQLCGEDERTIRAGGRMDNRNPWSARGTCTIGLWPSNRLCCGISLVSSRRAAGSRTMQAELRTGEEETKKEGAREAATRQLPPRRRGGGCCAVCRTCTPPPARTRLSSPPSYVCTRSPWPRPFHGAQPSPRRHRRPFRGPAMYSGLRQCILPVSRIAFPQPPSDAAGPLTAATTSVCCALSKHAASTASYRCGITAPCGRTVQTTFQWVCLQLWSPAPRPPGEAASLRALIPQRRRARRGSLHAICRTPIS